MEKENYALFVDNSGSVGGSENYWSTVQTVLDSYAKDISHYFLWNSSLSEVKIKDIEGWIKSKKGTGGTSPDIVANEIVRRHFTHIILVTDGEVGDGSVQACDRTFDEA
jgi:hypothetical protein